MLRDPVRRGLLDWQGRSHAQGALPWPWSFGSTAFQLTPLARSLRGGGTIKAVPLSPDSRVIARCTLAGGDESSRKQRGQCEGSGHTPCVAQGRTRLASMNEAGRSAVAR